MLRIISGERKGRVIKTVAEIRTRPTTDKVKESLLIYFSLGCPAVIFYLFSGTGNLGLKL